MGPEPAKRVRLATEDNPSDSKSPTPAQSVPVPDSASSLAPAGSSETGIDRHYHLALSPPGPSDLFAVVSGGLPSCDAPFEGQLHLQPGHDLPQETAACSEDMGIAAADIMEHSTEEQSHGTLVISHSGRSKYFGPTAASEWLKDVSFPDPASC